MHNTPHIIFYFINHAARVYPWLDALMVAVTRYGIQLMLLVWGVYLVRRFMYNRDPRVQIQTLFEALRTSGVLISVWAIVWCIKVLSHIPRPFEAISGVRQLVDETSHTSFPSQHAALAVALATAVYASNKRIGKYLFVLAALICLSRIFVGVHYPIDVLGGFLIGFIIPKIIHRIF